MTTVTLKEAVVLRNIARNLMTPVNGGEPETAADTECWVDSILDCGPVHMEPASLPGVMASLTKKGLVNTDGKVAALTDAGLAAYRESSTA